MPSNTQSRGESYNMITATGGVYILRGRFPRMYLQGKGSGRGN